MREVIVIGGGIIGCSAAAFLAERGVQVTLFERESLGAGASGRNLGSVQHPYDAELEPLHLATIEQYRELARDEGFDFPAAPAGLLLLATETDGLRAHAEELARLAPILRPQLLEPAEVTALEPALAPDVAAVRLETGYPVPPHGAVTAFASRARHAGAELRIGVDARPVLEGGRSTGIVTGDGERHAADAVLLAGGPWSPELLPPDLPPLPIRRTWGVTLQLELPDAPRHVLEEEEIAGAEASDTVGGAFRWSIPTSPHAVFSLATAAGRSALGSTFFLDEPDPVQVAPALIERGQRFMPMLDASAARELRRCARPQSVDGRPFIGPYPDADGLFLCAGHGPWGISTGPASSALVVDALLGSDRIPATLAAERLRQIG